MKYFLFNILLALNWMFLTGDLDFTNFVEGFLISFAIILIIKSTNGSDNYLMKIPKVISFIFYFIYELIVANLKVAKDILIEEFIDTENDISGLIGLPLKKLKIILDKQEL